MKALLKINFTDFWAGFIKEDNYFINLLKKRYEVVLSDNPDFLFYSCYGNEYLQYNCIRIFYTAENLRPDFSACDYAFSYDFSKKKNHYRLPLYVFYIDQQYFSGSRSKKMDQLLKIDSPEKILNEWRKKNRFCCMVVSNGKSKKRLNFFKKLSKIKHVDSGGNIFNNIGGPIKDKLSFIDNYQFVISFENSAYPGYVTEKILEPLFMGCIPIYWGNPEVQKDFNPKRFLNLDDFKSEEEMINRIIDISENETEAFKVLSEPIFPGNKIPEYIREENVLNFLDKIVSEKDICIPVATQIFKKGIHYLKRKKSKMDNIFRTKVGRYFR